MTYENLSSRIRNVLDLRQMTQADLARKTGFSTALISQICSGKTNSPHFNIMVGIADALEVSLDYLAGRK